MQAVKTHTNDWALVFVSEMLEVEFIEIGFQVLVQHLYSSTTLPAFTQVTTDSSPLRQRISSHPQLSLSAL